MKILVSATGPVWSQGQETNGEATISGIEAANSPVCGGRPTMVAYAIDCGISTSATETAPIRSPVEGRVLMNVAGPPIGLLA